MNGLLTYKQASEHVGLSMTSIRRLVRHGRIAVYRLGSSGGVPRFKAEDLDKYIDSCRKVGGRGK